MENSILQNNLSYFSKRFPQLYNDILPHQVQDPASFGVELCKAKNNEITCKYENTFIHSVYNPSLEGKKIAQATEIEESNAVVFLGCNLGYAPIECATLYKNKTIIIIEPSLDFLFLAFSTLDWQKVLSHESIVFLLQAPQETVIAVLEQYGLKEMYFVLNKPIMLHAEQYFCNLQKLIERNKRKESINTRTLEKFSTLWLSNMCKNLSFMGTLDGINRYQNQACNLSAVLLAAGPSLDDTLPHLKDLKKRHIIICVDTALRACLKTGVEPHFIILIDPQYWNSLHLQGLKSPSSILITETAAYPSVFRFICKEIILCSSNFPLGKYIENLTQEKGELSAGGSVATTAWDFARFIGCKKIYMAGLDLSYTNTKTHVNGSTFEERIYSNDNKLKPSQTELTNALFTPLQERATSYDGKKIITDSRMKMYAWWFESKCAQNPHINTYSLSENALAIPGVKIAKINDILHTQEMQQELNTFMQKKNSEKNTIKMDSIIATILDSFSDLNDIVQSGLLLCSKHCKTDSQYENVIKDLEKIDIKISQSVAKNLVSLVFPTPDQLQKIFDDSLPPPPPKPPLGTYSQAAQFSIMKSRLLYEAIKKSIREHTRYLRKNV